MNDREIGAPIADIETRANEDGTVVLFGYAARFNSPSKPIGGRFIETIAPGAFDDVLAGDVVALFDHDTRCLLGRTGAGSLRLSVDELGLRYEVDLDMEDPDAIAVHRKLHTRKITGSSFMFSVAESGDTWDRSGEVLTRTIFKVGQLYDVGPVTFPAYPEATAAVRSLEQFTSLAEAQNLEDKAKHELVPFLNDADARARAIGLVPTL